MKRKIISAVICLTLLGLAGSAQGKEKKPKPGPMAGTWECTSHGGSRGDLPFTLYLEQSGETVTGSVESPLGGTEITSAKFKNKTLEIHIDTSQGNYLLTAKLKKGKLTGEWSHEPEKGTWEGMKQTQTGGK